MSKQAKPPPPGDKPVPTAPPPPPRWRNWLWPIAIFAVFALWLILPTAHSTSTSLSYSQFLTDVSRAQGQDDRDRQHAGRHEHRHADQTGSNYTVVIPPQAGPDAADQLQPRTA